MSDSPTETMGYWALTDFGKTSFWKLYSVIIVFIEFILPVLTLCVINAISWAKLRDTLSTKTRITPKNERNNQKANVRFTKIIIILTSICILTRFFDGVMAIFYRLKLFLELNLSDELTALTDLIKFVSLFLMYASHALDGLIYYFYDTNFKRIFQSGWLVWRWC